MKLYPFTIAIALASLMLCAAIPAAFGSTNPPQEDSQPVRGNGRRN
ncbi:hypothetical protein [Nostoc sp. UHCC 0870]|nr:hypothetical protein [Nostoc sp. UHCC 0870]UKP01590.1 hypothetical protein L6494_30780 [Nostoc sp. UHCC 0870]